MWTKMVVIALSLLLGFSVSYGQGRKAATGRKQTPARTQAKVPALEVLNLRPLMRKTVLREGRNVIHTLGTGVQIIAIVRENSVVGYDAVNSRGESLPMTIVPDPVQEERARKIKERIDQAAQRAAEYKHCLELLGWAASPPIEKGCWVMWLFVETGEVGYGYIDCPKGW